MAGVDGLFIDFYGTLVGGDGTTVERVCQEMVDEGVLPTTASALAEAWGHQFFKAIEASNGASFRSLYACEATSLHHTMEELGCEIDAAKYVTRLHAVLRRPPVYEEVPDMLRRLHVPVWIVSNADRSDVDEALGHVGMRFAGVVTSEDAKSYKPHDGIFRLALERSGWDPDRVIHVGDSLHSDIGGAQACGLGTVWVNRAGRISDIGTATPDHEMATMAGLPDLVAAVVGEERLGNRHLNR